MTAELQTVDVRTRRQWRAWLAKHHASSPGIWLVFHKRHTEITSMPKQDMVREALCFGWIDSLVKRLDDDRFAVKVTPRKATSKWSAINRRLWRELKEAGLLAPAGLAMPPTKNTYGPMPVIPELPAYFAKAIKADPKAWKVFTALPSRERRNFVVWVHMAKRPETREKRLGESRRLLAAGRRLGLK
jgi:uncharacterized protein YdeI (YjbR/CyaY-like superfamily)